MTISSLTKKLTTVAVATLVTVAAAGSAEAAYGDNGMTPAWKDVVAARDGAAVSGDVTNREGVCNQMAATSAIASGAARWSVAGIDPSRALGASLARK
jgi:hypothetical protein